MSSEELAFELVYERSDEATRIVMDLRRRGYSNTEIADITGTGIKRIQLLLKSNLRNMKPRWRWPRQHAGTCRKKNSSSN